MGTGHAIPMLTVETVKINIGHGYCSNLIIACTTRAIFRRLYELHTLFPWMMIWYGFEETDLFLVLTLSPFVACTAAILSRRCREEDAHLEGSGEPEK